MPASNLANLADPDPAVRLAAISALREQPIPLPALIELGRLAANDPDPSVRSAALGVLRSEGAQAVNASHALPREARLEIVQQINYWQISGSITAEQAEVLRLRYGFDIQPGQLPDTARQQLAERIQRWAEQALISPLQAENLTASLFWQASAPRRASAPAPAAAVNQPEAAAKVPEGPAAASPTLTQILFSETSIRIALFLGGFLIVAAALILAALVAAVRLPVLLGLAAASGAGALISRKRLPLPSFVLYIIFASLLPIVARVLADLLHLTGTASDAYWSAAWALLALALAIGTRLYSSRLMSFAALGGLVAAGFELAALLPGEGRALDLLLALAAAAGALGAAALTRWKNFRFALPLYLGAHLVALAALLYTAARILLDLLDDPFLEPGRVDWLYFAFAWAAAAGFYLIADRYVRRFALLPYLAVGSLVFFPATLAQAFSPGAVLMAAIITGWGAVFALGGAALDQRPLNPGFLARYSQPLMFAAPVLFAWAALIGLDQEVFTGLILLLVAAAVLTALNVFRQRRWAWTTALLFGLMAYFAFFDLPSIHRLDLNQTFIALLPGLLLLVPDFFNCTTEGNQRWRVPARWVGLVLLGMVAFAILMSAIDGNQVRQQEGAAVYTIIAIFFLILALRRGLAGIATITPAFLMIALVLFLTSRDTAHWLPWMAGLAVVFYATGWGLLRRGHSAWSDIFRFSALGLGFLFLFRLPFEVDWIGGLSIAAAGGLFLVELLWGPHAKLSPWLEVPLDIVLISALFGLLNPVFRADESLAWALGLFIAALIVLGLEMFLKRRQGSELVFLRWGAHAAGILLAAASLVFNIMAPHLPAGWAAAIFAVSGAYALLAARAYRLPGLGYVLIGYLALALFFLLRAFQIHAWLAPEIAFATLVYGLSFLAARQESRTNGAATWVEVLRYGGLALALILSLTAPLEQNRLWASLWTACAATLYAVEAFRRRSVWWGFPTDGLYLLAYFLLLIGLHVDQWQFFSVAVAGLGMLQHYLLIRTGSRVGAFITGMVSQLVLLGTTYCQMTATQQLSYFAILFFQGLAVLVYGIVIRSRSLVITPLVFIVLGVMTVVLSILSGVPTAIIIGCTGILLLTLGILAVILRDRLVEASEKMGGWRA